ncbi:MAG: Uma2 family endonuclease [Gemmataceae bacterium]
MTTDTAPETLAELIDRLGGVALDRVRCRPAPGTATEQDVLAVRTLPERWLCELVDGVLIHKGSTFLTSVIAAQVGAALTEYACRTECGIALAANMPYRLAPGLVRIPDASDVCWERFEDRAIPDEEIGTVVPDLVVEVCGPRKTEAEMARKLKEYFLAGTRMVWIIDPPRQTAAAYTSPDVCKRIGKTGSLDGGDVLPGFKLALPELFARPHRRRRAN